MKLKMGLLAGLIFFGLRVSAFAEDYYVPIKKELEPMARLPLPQFELSSDTMKYTLPEDITGRKIHVELKHDPTDMTFPRVFQGPLATASCMGDNILPACVITHKNLHIDSNQVARFLAEKYRDPERLIEATIVAGSFISGNTPIGFISKRSLVSAKDMPRRWNAEWLSKASDGASRVLDARGDLIFTSEASGYFQNHDGVWELAQVNRHAMHISGVINWKNEGVRWFDVSLNTDQTALQGTWGRYDAGGRAVVAGTLSANEVPVTRP